jgi:hypothetical protein
MGFFFVYCTRFWAFRAFGTWRRVTGCRLAVFLRQRGGPIFRRRMLCEDTDIWKSKALMGG